MGRPYRLYCLSLVERLGFKTLDALYAEMDNNQIMEWWAFDKTQNQDWLKEYNTQVNLEKQQNQTLEEEAERIKAMFMGLGKK
jgi:hypothetical protein